MARLSPPFEAMRQRVGELEEDVGECGQVESELRSEIEGLRVFKWIIEDSPNGFSVVDRHYVYRTVNQLNLELHIQPVDQIVGHTVADLLGEAVFQEIVRPNLDRCFAGETVRYEVWFTYPSGGNRFMDITINSVADGPIVYDTEGNIIRMNPAAENLTGYSPEERQLPTAERMALLRFEAAASTPFLRD